MHWSKEHSFQQMETFVFVFSHFTHANALQDFDFPQILMVVRVGVWYCIMFFRRMKLWNLVIIWLVSEFANYWVAIPLAAAFIMSVCPSQYPACLIWQNASVSQSNYITLCFVCVCVCLCQPTRQAGWGHPFGGLCVSPLDSGVTSVFQEASRQGEKLETTKRWQMWHTETVGLQRVYLPVFPLVCTGVLGTLWNGL